MAYHAARERVMLFGGLMVSGSNSSETWDWDGIKWVQVAPILSPAGREYQAMAYDSVRQRTVLFGGIVPAGELADTWEYGRAEVCNGIDDNADGVIPDNEVDHDGDGYVACGPWVGGTPGVLGGGDCDETNPAIHPGVAEVCNGIDENCDSTIDEGFDEDGDGSTVCSGDCADLDSVTYPGAAQLCDGKNNDCLDPTWPTVAANEADADGDGSRICAGDCNDNNSGVRPGAPEICDGIDDNCNGQIDEDLAGVDSDGDAVHNACDNCRFSYNPAQQDTDHDGLGNACDNCITVPNPGQADLDADQRGDICDNCPSSYNPFQDDFDSDSFGDACDNCIYDSNPGQSDIDSDYEGDVCDLNDGLIIVTLLDQSTVNWQLEQGFQAFNEYRGSIAVLRQSGLYTQDPISTPLAERNCYVFDPFVVDGLNPGLDQAVFYLVTGMSGGAESSLGTNSAGSQRVNSNPCP